MPQTEAKPAVGRRGSQIESIGLYIRASLVGRSAITVTGSNIQDDPVLGTRAGIGNVVVRDFDIERTGISRVTSITSLGVDCRAVVPLS